MEKEYRVPQYVVAVQKIAPKQDVSKIIFHSGVTTIEADAFRDWKNVTDVVFEAGSRLERIQAHAFADTALREFVAPKGLKEIGAGVFAGCKSLKFVRLNENLEKIGGEGDGAFQNSGVEKVYMSSNLKEMAQNTFTGCANFRKIEIVAGYGDLTMIVSARTGSTITVNAK